MCLILFAHKIHADYPLVLAANRDESYARPTAAAAFWTDDPRVYAGRDLEQGGTWLGITRDGAFAAVTNFREGKTVPLTKRSRGELVADYLRDHLRPGYYLQNLQENIDEYNGFNLIAGSVNELRYLSNRAGPASTIAPGVHGLSNHLLDTQWPKVKRGKTALNDLLQTSSRALIDALFSLLAEREFATDDTLPESGVGLARERVLSPAFIASPTYGTRSSTVLLVNNHGDVEFIERSFSEHGDFAGVTSARFSLASPTTSAPG